MTDCAWKPNWEEAKRHYTEWWEHRGLVLDLWGGPPANPPHEDVADPGPAPDIETHYTDAAWRGKSNHYRLSRGQYPADALPQAAVDIGPGSLALILGARPGLRYDTVWYWPCWEGIDEPEKLPPVRFDPGSPWWRAHEAALRECVRLGRGKYFTGCPDLIENADILASLRGMLPMLEDMVVRPDWVVEKIAEINRAWFEAYDRVYDIIRLADGGSCFSAFHIWGPGKTAKLQCDCSASFSPAMFKRFVVPALSGQCEWLDHSLFHLDGEHCIRHLDLLLSIKALDAIEWTPNPKVPSGGDPRWYEMYNKILHAGKSVQAVGINPDQVKPLLDACGGKGMFIMSNTNSLSEIERLIKVVEPYR